MMSVPPRIFAAQIGLCAANIGLAAASPHWLDSWIPWRQYLPIHAQTLDVGSVLFAFLTGVNYGVLVSFCLMVTHLPKMRYVSLTALAILTAVETWSHVSRYFSGLHRDWLLYAIGCLALCKLLRFVTPGLRHSLATTASPNSFQFTLRDVGVLVTVAAIWLSVFRLLEPTEDVARGHALFAPELPLNLLINSHWPYLFPAMVLASTLLTHLLSWRRIIALIILLPATMGLGAILQAFLVTSLDPSRMFLWDRSFAEVAFGDYDMYIGGAIVIALNFLCLRRLGWRLAPYSSERRDKAHVG